MKIAIATLSCAIFMFTGCGLAPSSQGDQETQMTSNEGSRWDALMSLPFPENYPTAEAANQLHDELLFQRACQVVIWSMPATALWAMKKGSEAEFGEGSNVFPIWKDRLSAETIVSTPNSDVIYGMGYLVLKLDGPTVIEVPP